MQSREELFEAVNKHLHCILALKELNMGCATDKRIQVIVCDAKIDVYPVEYILRQVLKNVLRHLNIDVTFSLVAIRPITDLNPG